MSKQTRKREMYIKHDPVTRLGHSEPHIFKGGRGLIILSPHNSDGTTTPNNVKTSQVWQT